MARPLLALVASVVALGGCREPRGVGLTDAQELGYDIVYPIKVDEKGLFVSYNLTYRLLSKRAASSQNRPLAFYQLHHKGQQLQFNLSLNSHLLAPGFVTERRYGGIARAKIQAYNQNSCHMIGSVENQEQESGLAALSACDGLKGVFQLANEDFFIEPLAASKPKGNATYPHRIYRRHVPEYEDEGLIAVASTKRDRKRPAIVRTCGVKESLNKAEKRRERWEQKQRRKLRIQRSVSQEKWVETLVVADTKMVEYHGRESVEKYVLTVMNMVAGLFHDASIGNPIHISVVRLIFLEEEEEDLKITHHADNTLRSFCKWQKAVNLKGDAHPLHHDVAILLTRKDICAAMNRPCETLGLSHVSGMCQPHRSCNINEDTGLPLAFTVAHELGHSFGIQHDGSGNDCEPVGKRPFVMSPQLLYDTSPLTWSYCSRQYITRFLDRGWGLCLDDPPAKDIIDYPAVPPGVLYDVSHQCRLQYGPYSTYCEDMDSICNTLWCSVGTTCHSKLDAAVDGTTCDNNKWCFNGECMPMGYRPESIDGGWAVWTSWAACSRTCGAGMQNAERQCNAPTPKYGGKYCVGERKRFRVCNMKSCPTDRPSFRQLQCSRFDARPYKGKLYKWTSIPNNINPCELHCRPEDEYFSEKLRDAVIDGTPCYEGNSSRDMCINGICKNIGCDYEIDSYAVEDRCGVCRGDGSTCQTVQKTFEEREGQGYVDVGLIPSGARAIRIEEVAEAENFLALRSEDPEKYFLNGGWTIQWNGDYKVAGTTFTYERTGNWENLTSPGPTEEPVWIQLLFQEKNPGIRYQYTIPRESDNENEITPAEFFWRYGSWTRCTATCGTGVQRQIVHCIEKVAGNVEERYCDMLSRPDDRQRSCSENPCPARWWSGEWQGCSATCGDTGLKKRTVLCIQSVAVDEQRALQPGKCQHLSRPDSRAPCNREVLCPAQWVMGNWSECSATCGDGTQWRPVYCPNDTRASCELGQRPESKISCSLMPCWNRIENSILDWSGSGSSSRELFNEIDFIPSHHIPKFIPSVPKSEDLNVITERDFSSGRKGNVFVDDFYYDYNFINFHEDLVYDPLDDKNAKEGDLKPDLGTETVVDVKDSQVTLPNVLPTIKPEDGMKQGSTTSSVIVEHNQEEGDRNNVVNLPQAVDTTAAASTASSYIAAKAEDVQPPLPEDDTPVSATTRDFSANSDDRTTIDDTQEGPFASTVLEEGPSVMVSSTSFPHLAFPTPMIPSSKGGNGRGRESGISSGSTEGPERSLKAAPDHGSRSDKDLLDVSQEAHGEQSNTGQALIKDNEGTSTTANMAEFLASTVRGVAAHPSQFIEAAPDLQDTRENSKGLEDIKSSPNSDPIKDAQNRRHFPSIDLKSKSQESFVTDVPPVVSTRAFLSGLPEYGSKTLTPHNPNSLGLQVSAEPRSSEHVTAFPNAFPPMLPTPRWKESSQIKTNLDSKHIVLSEDQDLFRSRNGIPRKSLPNGVDWIFSNSDEDLLTPTKHQGWRPNEETSSVPSATIASPFNASWEATSWSQCSTTCGLGAIWRTVRCSTGKDEDCNPTQKPIPARRCYLRPCSTWRVGNWTKCSRTCGGGVTFRDVSCIDTRDRRPLRPFHCQAILFKPPRQMPCQEEPCLDWYTSSWRECSEPCGGGDQERLVTCPEFGKCDETLRPNSTRPCNSHPCTKWRVGSWGQCTAMCGGGIQRRQVKCINAKTGEAEEDNSLCDHERWPENTQKCNLQECLPTEPNLACVRDRLSFSFCQTLLFLGRCHLPTVSAQCCQTCRQHSHGIRDRGNERVSRK